MANFSALVTDAGRAKIAANVAAGKPIQIPTCAAGDGNGETYTPTKDQLDLRHRVWAGAVNKVMQNAVRPTTLDIRVIIPADVGGFTVREWGLYDEDGGLLAVAVVPDSYKPVVAEGATSELLQTLHLTLTSANGITLQIDTSDATATQGDLSEHNTEGASHGGHFVDAVRHITGSERTSWAEAASGLATHAGNTSVHWSSGDRELQTNTVTLLVGHVSDPVPHVSAADRDRWNAVSSDSGVVSVTSATGVTGLITQSAGASTASTVALIVKCGKLVDIYVDCKIKAQMSDTQISNFMANATYRPRMKNRAFTATIVTPNGDVYQAIAVLTNDGQLLWGAIARIAPTYSATIPTTWPAGTEISFEGTYLT
ncbi:MAG: phage tail protein [Oscillospiraceae bacterium]|jgi:phage-related tail fiber protein|nr:phage tail protein [Oscillospiraceae bacterium]